MNTVGLIVLSIAFGIVLNMIKKDGLPLVNLFRSLWTATMKLVEIIMWYVVYTVIIKVLVNTILRVKYLGHTDLKETQYIFIAKNLVYLIL